MKQQLLLAALITLGLNAAASACVNGAPPGPVVTLPPGQDAKLPVIQPDIVSRNVGGNNDNCIQRYFGYTATLTGLSNDEVTKRFGPASNVVLTTPWQSAATYVAGNRASYNGANYTAKWWTQGEAPGNVNGAWEADASNGLQSWDASRAYTGGNQVVFAGKLYEAKWWTQGEEPGAVWGAWLLKGDSPPGIPNFTTMPGEFTVATSLADGRLTLNFRAAQNTTYTHRVSPACTVETTSVTTGSKVFGERWRVHLDGGLSYVTALPAPINSGTQPPPPPPARKPDGSCSVASGTVLQTNAAQTLQATSVTVGTGNQKFAVVWACNIEQTSCRASNMLDFHQMGAYGPPWATYQLAQ